MVHQYPFHRAMFEGSVQCWEILRDSDVRAFMKWWKGEAEALYLLWSNLSGSNLCPCPFFWLDPLVHTRLYGAMCFAYMGLLVFSTSQFHSFFVTQHLLRIRFSVFALVSVQSRKCTQQIVNDTSLVPQAAGQSISGEPDSDPALHLDWSCYHTISYIIWPFLWDMP